MTLYSTITVTMRPVRAPSSNAEDRGRDEADHEADVGDVVGDERQQPAQQGRGNAEGPQQEGVDRGHDEPEDSRDDEAGAGEVGEQLEGLDDSPCSGRASRSRWGNHEPSAVRKSIRVPRKNRLDRASSSPPSSEDQPGQAEPGPGRTAASPPGRQWTPRLPSQDPASSRWARICSSYVGRSVASRAVASTREPAARRAIADGDGDRGDGGEPAGDGVGEEPAAAGGGRRR